jgi:quercetin dioxygenase-like cupin family protein
MNQAPASEAAAVPIARGPGKGAVLDILGAPYIVKAHAAETADAFLCIEHKVPLGSGVPPHTHTHEDEIFYVLEGEITFETADLAAPLRLGAGGFVFSPRGQRHTFRNEGPAEARLLVLVLPGAGLERMFQELDAAGRQSGGAPSIDEITAITARAGVIIAS